MRLNSIAVKLTLAFLFIGVTGAVLVAVFVRQSTQRQFDRFLLDRIRVSRGSDLIAYYQTMGSWDGADAVFSPYNVIRRTRISRFRFPVPAILVAVDGRVAVGGRRYQVGDHVPARIKEGGIPIVDGGEVIGWLVPDVYRNLPGLLRSPEENFLHRISTAALYSAFGASALALILGLLLARTLTRPIKELITATRALAQGDLGQQVKVHSQDELGELSISFNQMSTDLQRSNQLRRQMTADIAHDLRSPLSVILGYTEALSEGKLDATPETFSVMHLEAQSLNRLIDDLRTLSLADAGELSLNLTWVPPAALIERAASAHQPLAEGKGITLGVEIDPHLPEINVDPDRMAQVLGNLISNALRHTQQGGWIKLSARREGAGVYLGVQDNGSGIAPEELSDIFNRFYRGDRSRQVHGEAGLGLTIAKSLVEAQGGIISVQSQPGEGATFTIHFPI